MISDKGVFGMISGVVTTVMLQPFENIKMALMIPPLSTQGTASQRQHDDQHSDQLQVHQ
jgi:hypothetical protein